MKRQIIQERRKYKHTTQSEHVSSTQKLKQQNFSLVRIIVSKMEAQAQKQGHLHVMTEKPTWKNVGLQRFLGDASG